MQSLDVRALSQTLSGLRLLTDQQLSECLAESPDDFDGQSLLDICERKGYLTSYQLALLRKGEASGLVLGRYIVLYQNASGSFARVYRARSMDNGQMVGLKVLRKRWSEDPNSVAMFRREAELCKTLRHENIVPIYEVITDGDRHFFTMEFVEGGNLRDFINIRKQLTPVEATRCTLDMAKGLDYALSKGMTHRDLKMTNVLMSARGVSKLVDFGLAGTEGAEGSGGESAQRALEYATLEKGTGAKRDDPRSDLYFLGAIYYELLTGIPPLPRTRSRAERSSFARYSNVRPISQANPSLPRSVTQIVNRLMEVNPDRRYQTPAAVIQDLAAALTDMGEQRPVSSEPQKSAAPPARVIMCVENRQKHQDVLRRYLTQHGYRVLMLGDMQRSLNRIQETPPDFVVMMGDAIGDSVIDGFQDLMRTRPKTLGCVLVLGEKQSHLKTRVSDADRVRVLFQPITLRDLHREILGMIDGPNGKPSV